MLKTLSLTPDEARDDSETEDASESRMLRALNALSSNAPPADADGRHTGDARYGGEARHGGGQMRGKPRESGRNDAAAAHFARARHRFVKDGEVPVVHMATPRARDVPAPAVRPDADLARLQQALDEQRLRADQSERAKQEALTLLKALQTKCAHAEMALADALALAESRLSEIAALSERLAQVPEPVAAASPDAVSRRAPRLRLQPSEPAEAAEPEPVQWWLTPSHGGGKRTRRTGAAG